MGSGQEIIKFFLHDQSRSIRIRLTHIEEKHNREGRRTLNILRATTKYNKLQLWGSCVLTSSSVQHVLLVSDPKLCCTTVDHMKARIQGHLMPPQRLQH